MNVLEIDNVSKRFGNLVAVRDVSLSVAKGELCAIIGPNGAGKTTFFNLITGFFPPTSGTIAFDGSDITRLSTHERVTRGMARTFQITEIFPELTVFENVRIAAEVAGGYRLRPWINRAEQAQVHARVEETLKLVSLETKADRLVGELAHGDQRAAEIAMALALKPHLLLLDEPTAGMGDQETYQITQLIRRLHRDSNYTIVLIEHDMRVVFHLADRICVLDQGRMLARGHAAGNRRQRDRSGRLSGQRRMTAALIAEGLHTYYGKSHILHGVSLEVAEGKITALLGRNGAGKTTTLRSLMGLTPRARRRGHDLRRGDHALADLPDRRAGVGYVPEGRRIFANLSVEENLKVPLERGGPWTVAADLPAVSAAGGTQAQPRPSAFRRRAGDALDRPRPAAQSADC